MSYKGLKSAFSYRIKAYNNNNNRYAQYVPKP